jgi:hypothetical protein
LGSIYKLMVGDIEVIGGKNYLTEDVLVPFQATDLRHDEVNGEATLHEYRASAVTVARRLELLGHSMARARRAYVNGVCGLEDWERENWPARLLHQDGFEQWCRTILAEARSVQDGRTGDPIDDHPPHWEETLLGFPGGHPGDVLRALVPPETPVTLDLTDMLLGGWIDDEEDPCNVEGRTPLIILTEGTSDSRLLDAALRTLHPEVSDFVRFIDYETANPQGGTSQLVQFVKMFVGHPEPDRGSVRQ